MSKSIFDQKCISYWMNICLTNTNSRGHDINYSPNATSTMLMRGAQAPQATCKTMEVGKPPVKVEF